MQILAKILGDEDHGDRSIRETDVLYGRLHNPGQVIRFMSGMGGPDRGDLQESIEGDHEGRE